MTITEVSSKVVLQCSASKQLLQTTVAITYKQWILQNLQHF